MGINDAIKFEIWRNLILSEKSVFNWPAWNRAPMFRESRKNATEAGRLPFVSDIAARLEMLVTLADANDVAIEGVRVRLVAWQNRPLEDVTATFEYFDLVRWVCISRIAFLPLSPHPNKFWRKFGLEPEINGSHIHTCEDNIKIGNEAFAPYGNLPNAIPLDKEPQSFKDISQSIGEFFNITGFHAVPAPEWNWSLQYDR